jgi:hypothetical protein
MVCMYVCNMYFYVYMYNVYLQHVLLLIMEQMLKRIISNEERQNKLKLFIPSIFLLNKCTGCGGRD